MQKLELSLTEYAQRLFDALDSFTQKPYWRLKLCLLVSLLAIALHFPRIDYALKAINPEFAQDKIQQYPHIKQAFGWSHWPELEKRIAQPFSASTAEPSSHEAKMALRLTIPVFAHYLKLTSLHILLLQTCLSFLSFFVVLRLVEKISNDSTAAILFLLASIPLHYLQTGVFQFSCKMDSFAYFFLLLAMLCRAPLAIIAATFLSCWTDERAILASFLVFCFWVLRENFESITFKKLVFGNKQSWAAIIGICLFVASRVLVESLTELKTPIGAETGIELSLFLRSIDLFWTGTWSALRGGWILVLLMYLLLINARQYLLSAALLVVSMPMLIGSFFVFDITRSAAYLFPLLFIATLVVVKTIPRFEYLLTLSIVFVVNLISSPLNMVSAEVNNNWRMGLSYIANQPLLTRVLDYIYYFGT